MTRRDYGGDWKEKRKEAMERDNHSCRVCGSPGSFYKPLHVHHVIPVKEFDDVSVAHERHNLITLCKTHHRLVETGRIDCPDPEDIDDVDQGDVLDY